MIEHSEKLNQIWPPNYSIRRSQRARYIRLVVSAKKGLEIVLPRRASQKDAIEFLNSKRTWVEKHVNTILLKSLDKEKNHFILPSSIYYRAIDKYWDVDYGNAVEESSLKLRHLESRLIFSRKVKSSQEFVRVTKRFLKKTGEEILIPWLANTANICRLHYHAVTIRGQNTLWGSCSRQKNISLNYKLLFLPPLLVDYVLVHELCHTKYLNHSQRFWNLVAQFCPHYRKYDKQLRQADIYLPRWLLD